MATLPHRNITALLARQPLAVLSAIAVAMFAAITALMFFFPEPVRLSPLYVLVVGFATFFIGARWGMLVSLVAMVAVELIRPRSMPVDVVLLNSAVDLGLFLAFVFILDEIKMLYARERDLSRTDGLTGLLNRRAFTEALESEVARMGRSGGPLTLVYLDLDNFKAVNDSFGHSEGDRVLRSVSQAMQGSIRRTDSAARLGGDEFAILLPDTAQEAARAAVDKLTGELHGTMRERNWPVTSSIGAVTFLRPTASAGEMLGIADQTMYSVKQSGKNRAEFRIWS